MTGQLNYLSGSFPEVQWTVGSSCFQTAAVNASQYRFELGEATGTIRLYGIAK